MTSKIIFVLVFLSVSTIHITLFNITIPKKARNKPKNNKEKIYISLIEERVEKKASPLHSETLEKKVKEEKKKKKALRLRSVSLKKDVKQIHHDESVRKDEAMPRLKAPAEMHGHASQQDQAKKKALQLRSVSLKKDVKQVHHNESVRKDEALPRLKAPAEMHGHASQQDQAKKKEPKKVSIKAPAERHGHASQRIEKIENIKNIEEKYLAYIEKIVRKNLKYPRKARRKKKEGTVLLSINIDKFGSIKNIKIIKKSSSSILDKSAYKLFKSIDKFKEIPRELKKDSWNIKIPVVYRLRQNG